MKVYHCDCCGSLVFFDNVTCVKCGHTLGFLPALRELCSLEPAGNDTWKTAAAAGSGQTFRQCANARQYQVCNWMVDINDPNPFCVSCRLNDTIPNLQIAGNQERWQRLEMAKRRVIYTILQLGLPVNGAENRPALRFNFLADTNKETVPTGHEHGLVTINISEADDAERERRRVMLREPYRTLLGHLRHETAHYYWERLIENSPWLNRYRINFGNEERDYGEALKIYYQQGPPANWQSRYVSAYASSHPWEDWAETWAHYFHIIDTVETAASFGLTLQPKHPAAKVMTSNPKTVTVPASSFDQVLEHWFPLTNALNSLNRGMGLHDLYPFALSSPAIEKLRFVHEVVQVFSPERKA